MDDMVGTLEVGKKADLLVLSQDPFSVVPAMIAKTRVLTTIVGGRVVYDIAGQVPGDGVSGRKTKR